jgi:YesN/AraC family two-component response regulator
LLTEYYGMSFSEKLQAEKMRFGKYLLETTYRSIGEISEICGVTPTYFIRCFKKNMQ